MTQQNSYIKEEREDEVVYYEFEANNMANHGNLVHPGLDQRHMSSGLSSEDGFRQAYDYESHQPATEYIQYIPDATTQQHAQCSPQLNKFESIVAEPQSQEPFITRRMSRALSRHYTEISQFDVDSPIPQMLNYFVADEVEAAVACERVYGPDDATFVAGEAIKRAGMVTMYDSGMIPTFESDLEVAAYPVPINLEEYRNQIHEQTGDNLVHLTQDETRPVAVEAALSKKLTTQRRKLQCC